MQKENCRDLFEENLVKWANAVIIYSKTTQVRNSVLQLALDGYDDICTTGMLIHDIMFW